LEKSEDGFFYISATGVATFLDRSSRQTLTRMTVSQATFTDDGTIAYSDIGFGFNADNLVNDVRRSGVQDVQQTVTDPTSIQTYFRRSSSEDLLVSDNTVARDLAAVYLDRYKEPIFRVGGVKLMASRSEAVFVAAVGRELLDLVTVERTPQGIGTTYTADQLVDGIEHSFNQHDWQTTLSLSPAFITDYFTFDSADLGVLDEDRLGG
jgi:hypothetical protein